MKPSRKSSVSALLAKPTALSAASSLIRSSRAGSLGSTVEGGRPSMRLSGKVPGAISRVRVRLVRAERASMTVEGPASRSKPTTNSPCSDAAVRGWPST
jgi:hypothetical protein